MNRKELFEKKLAILSEKGCRRSLAIFDGSGGRIEGARRTVLNFSSNDYLNLANNPRVKAAARSAVTQYGCSAVSSRLMSGTLPVHKTLEAELARFTGREATLVFGSGFMTNLGVIAALAGRKDGVFEDRFNHASLIDGARLSEAALYRYRHNDPDHLASLLRKHTTGRRIIITDSVFSMDGDIARLADLAEAAQKYDALLIVDEAHALGVMGSGGCGLCRTLLDTMPPDRLIMTATLSKALGSYGGFAAGSALLKEFLINTSRSFIFSTALPPASCRAALEAVRIVEEDSKTNSPACGEVLLARAERFRNELKEAGFNTGASSTHIIPVIAGGNEQAVAFARHLAESGIAACAIRPPTVPPGTARIRFSLTLAHTDQDIDRTFEAVIGASEKTGLRP